MNKPLEVHVVAWQIWSFPVIKKFGWGSPVPYPNFLQQESYRPAANLEGTFNDHSIIPIFTLISKCLLHVPYYANVTSFLTSADLLFQRWMSWELAPIAFHSKCHYCQRYQVITLFFLLLQVRANTCTGTVLIWS